jgi:hypothetical protein
MSLMKKMTRYSIFDSRPLTLPRVFRVPPLIIAILICSSYAFAQFRPTERQVSETQGSRADQLPLSGRSMQPGSVTATQNPTPGAVGEFSRRLTVSHTQAMICAQKFNEILSGLPGTGVAFFLTSQEHYARSQVNRNSSDMLRWAMALAFFLSLC